MHHDDIPLNFDSELAEHIAPNAPNAPKPKSLQSRSWLVSNQSLSPGEHKNPYKTQKYPIPLANPSKTRSKTTKKTRTSSSLFCCSFRLLHFLPLSSPRELMPRGNLFPSRFAPSVLQMLIIIFMSNCYRNPFWAPRGYDFLTWIVIF